VRHVVGASSEALNFGFAAVRALTESSFSAAGGVYAGGGHAVMRSQQLVGRETLLGARQTLLIRPAKEIEAVQIQGRYSLNFLADYLYGLLSLFFCSLLHDVIGNSRRLFSNERSSSHELFNEEEK